MTRPPPPRATGLPPPRDGDVAIGEELDAARRAGTVGLRSVPRPPSAEPAGQSGAKGAGSAGINSPLSRVPNGLPGMGPRRDAFGSADASARSGRKISAHRIHAPAELAFPASSPAVKPVTDLACDQADQGERRENTPSPHIRMKRYINMPTRLLPSQQNEVDALFLAAAKPRNLNRISGISRQAITHAIAPRPFEYNGTCRSHAQGRETGHLALSPYK